MSRRTWPSSARLWERVEAPFEKLGGHLATRRSSTRKPRALDRFGAKLETIAEKADAERLETEDGVPHLPPVGLTSADRPRAPESDPATGCCRILAPPPGTS